MAGNTAGVADSHDILALILIRAANHFSCLIRCELDDVLRTGTDALAAGLAGFLVYLCDAVNDVDGIKWAGLYARTKTKAAVVAGLWSLARNEAHSNTVFKSCVLVIVLCLFTGS